MIMLEQATSEIRWEFGAQAAFDQLDERERGVIAHALERLAKGQINEGYDIRQLIVPSAGESLFTLRAGPDFRIVFRRQGQQIILLDIVRRAQLNGLQSLRLRHGEPG
jgi:hypothetical protein